MSIFKTNLEREIALESYRRMLGLAKDSLDKAEQAFNDAKERYDILNDLIKRAQVEVTGQDQPLPVANKEPVVTPSIHTRSSNLRKGELSSELVDLIIRGNVVLETGAIITAIRDTMGKPNLAKSSVAGSLAKLADDGHLRRVKTIKPGTSHYGLAEWFEGDKPKPEHQKSSEATNTEIDEDF